STIVIGVYPRRINKLSVGENSMADDLWSLLDKLLKVDVSWPNRTLTLTVGPLTVRDIPVGWIVKENKQPQVIADLLGDAFVKRRVNYATFEAEYPRAVAGSLKEVQVDLDLALAKISRPESPYPSTLQDAIKPWQNAAALCLKTVEEDFRKYMR